MTTNIIRMKKLLLLLVFGTFIAADLSAQVLRTEPIFPRSDGSVVIELDATQGNGGLEGYTGTVYVHIGVITDQSSSQSDWRYVQGVWGTSSAPVATRIEPDLYQFTINDIRAYFGVPSNENIEQVAILFRDLNATYVARSESGGDLFVDLYDTGFHAKLMTPANSTIVENNSEVIVKGGASRSASLELYLDGILVHTVTDSVLIDTLTISSGGSHTVKFVASSDGQVRYDSVSLTVNPPVRIEAVPSNIVHGVNYTSDSTVTLAIYAPYKEYIYVIGDFNNWELDTNYLMRRSTDPVTSYTYWLQIEGLEAGEQYAFQYFIDGELRVADPLSELVLDPKNDPYISSSVFPNLHPYPTGRTEGIVTLIEPGKLEYDWKVDSFAAPPEERLVIYELLVRDFVASHTYKGVIDSLDYLESLGINAIELMPVNEFEGNVSWGYNPSFHMALDKYYGTPDDLKALVDACHERGIAVILDVVYNHAFSQSPLCRMYWDKSNNRPQSGSPYANPIAKHDFNVGYDLNHESLAVQHYIRRVMEYWLTEFRVDGFRFDLSKGFTQKNTLGDVGAWGALDVSRVQNITRMFDEVRAVDPDAYVILEHLADNAEERILANYGCLLWGNLNYDCNEATMGYSSNLNRADYKEQQFNEPRYIAYAESHDEQRLMYKNLMYGATEGDYNIQDINTALDRIELNWVILGAIPGPKMLWQFGELGYEVSIDFNGRLGEKPIRWEYFQASNRRDVYEVYAAINELKTTYNVFSTSDYTLQLGSSVKTVHLNGSSMNVAILGNFSTTTTTTALHLQHTGTWYEYFTNDSIVVTDVDSVVELMAGEYRLYTDTSFNHQLEIGSVNDLNINIELYPNPAEDIICVISGEQPISEVQVFNIQGREVPSSISFRGKNASIDSRHWTPGVYFVKVKTGNSELVKRVIRK